MAGLRSLPDRQLRNENFDAEIGRKSSLPDRQLRKIMYNLK